MYDEDIVNISEISNNVGFFTKMSYMAVFSMDCKYISENTEDVRAPIAKILKYCLFADIYIYIYCIFRRY